MLAEESMCLKASNGRVGQACVPDGRACVPHSTRLPSLEFDTIASLAHRLTRAPPSWRAAE
eukprot:2157313-Pleurochrysis_carterae.AAC.1